MARGLTVQFVGVVFKTVPLDGDDWGICLILGLLSIPIGVASRFLPPFDFLNRPSDSAKVLPIKGETETGAG